MLPREICNVQLEIDIRGAGCAWAQIGGRRRREGIGEMGVSPGEGIITGNTWTKQGQSPETINALKYLRGILYPAATSGSQRAECAKSRARQNMLDRPVTGLALRGHGCGWPRFKLKGGSIHVMNQNRIGRKFRGFRGDNHPPPPPWIFPSKGRTKRA